MTDRELTALDKSTPTYLFRITDADGSGVDISNMKVMMCLSITCLSGIYKRYVTQDLDTTQFSYKYDESDPEINEVWFDETYAKNLGNGMFSVTVPLWRWGKDIISIEYQVFIYGNRVVSRQKSIIGDENTIVPGRIEHHNIMLDRGTITIEETLFPLTVEAYRTSIKQQTGLGDSEIDTILAIDFDSQDELTTAEFEAMTKLSTITDNPIDPENPTKPTPTALLETYGAMLTKIEVLASAKKASEVK